jgi:hypothetical protein
VSARDDATAPWLNPALQKIFMESAINQIIKHR